MPIDDDDDPLWDPHDPRNSDCGGYGGTDAPSPSASTGSAPPPNCPNCSSPRIEHRHLARRVFGTLGSVAGAAGAASRTWASVELGMAVGAGTAGPPGAVIGAAIGAVAGTVLSALGGAAAGCSLGIRLGDIADAHLLRDLHCLACGHCFGRKTLLRDPAEPSG